MSSIPPPQPWSWQPTPNEYTYGGPQPRAMELRGLVVAVTAVVLGSSAGFAFSAVARIHRASLIGDAINSGSPDFDALQQADRFVAVSGSVSFLALLGGAVLWIIWQYRYVSNARQLGVVELGPGWAIGGWFIPCANLGIVPTQLAQASEASDPGRFGGAPRRGLALIVVWALFWIGASIVTAVDGNVSFGSDDPFTARTPQEVRDNDRSTAFSQVLFMVAGVVGVAMIRALSSSQAEARARHAAAPVQQWTPPPPPPAPLWTPPPPGGPPPPPPL
jgi:hypothetical protein